LANGIVILLNGTSSSGKSSLAKVLQRVLERPYLHIDGDYFWQMFPRTYFEDKPDEEYRPWRSQFLPACYRSIATMVTEGINVIIDEVLTKPMTLTWLQEALARHEVVFVGLTCGVEELERRERERGNRSIGLARFQYPNIHIHGAYDIVVDTEMNDATHCALQIKEVVENGRAFTNFHQAVEQPLPDFKPS
jgi:chloramphenicol 3-O phosphotransferase